MDMSLCFPGLRRAVVLSNAPRLPAALAEVLHGWSPQPVAGRRTALSHVRGQGEGYAVDSPWLDAPFRGLSLASAVTAVCADLSEDWVDNRPGALALHAGGVVIGGRLVAFAGTHRAGKSTLAARLTAEPDMLLFADDVLPLTADGRAVGLGVAPRLRLPLPAAASPAFRDHVAAHLRLRDARYGYLDPALVARHGSTAPLGAFLVLSRRDGGPARLHRMTPSEAIAALLAQNMADAGSGGALHDHAVQVAGSVPCLRLVYADLEEAVALLRRAFGGADWPAAGIGIAPPLPAEPLPPPAPAAPPGARWRRARGTALRRRGDLVWLSQADTGLMVQLNPVAAAVWHLLAAPESARSVAGVLAEAFPGIPADRILADSAAVLGQLARDGLIRRA